MTLPYFSHDSHRLLTRLFAAAIPASQGLALRPIPHLISFAEAAPDPIVELDSMRPSLAQEEKGSQGLRNLSPALSYCSSQQSSGKEMKKKKFEWNLVKNRSCASGYSSVGPSPGVLVPIIHQASDNPPQSFLKAPESRGSHFSPSDGLCLQHGYPGCPLLAGVRITNLFRSAHSDLLDTLLRDTLYASGRKEGRKA
uniref:Predicted protein n=1 Tax=Physcomitrium patens TaxID=3218 RepID=A9U4E1_PHYPA